MQKLILFLLFTFFLKQNYAQHECDDNAIMIIKGTWKKHNDANMRPDKNIVQIKSNINKISKLFRLAYPEPKGMEAAWYTSMNHSSLITNGPTAYNFNSLYKSWYCNKYQQKLMLGDETGTWAYANINNLGSLISNQYDLLAINVNGQPVYILPAIKGEWKGYSVYEISGHDKNSRCILLTHKNQFPWQTISREQYLNALKKSWQEQKKFIVNSFKEQQTNLEKGIAETQNNKYLKPDDKEKIIAGLKKDLESVKTNNASQISKSEKPWNDKIAVIDDYINQNKTQLQQEAIINQSTMNNFLGEFSELEKGGRMLVTMNPSYFNMKLPVYIPQLIVMLWKWDDNAPARNFKKQLEENFPIEELKKMIDN